ncbi:MAG: hypothetical protein WCR98_04400 [Saccharofermentanales bacterium]
MLTEEERNEIINAAVEKALLMVPQVVGNMMEQMSAYTQINKDFYAAYPEFKQHRDIVQAVVESVDGKNPLMTLQEKLNEAVPTIREQIKLRGSLDVTKASRPNRDFRTFEADRPSLNNGEL